MSFESRRLTARRGTVDMSVVCTLIVRNVLTFLLMGILLHRRGL